MFAVYINHSLFYHVAFIKWRQVEDEMSRLETNLQRAVDEDHVTFLINCVIFIHGFLQEELLIECHTSYQWCKTLCWNMHNSLMMRLSWGVTKAFLLKVAFIFSFIGWKIGKDKIKDVPKFPIYPFILCVFLIVIIGLSITPM